MGYRSSLIPEPIELKLCMSDLITTKIKQEAVASICKLYIGPFNLKTEYFPAGVWEGSMPMRHIRISDANFLIMFRSNTGLSCLVFEI